MLIYKATGTLDAYLPELPFTENRAEAELLLVGGKKFSLDDFPKLKGIFKTGVGVDNLPFDEAASLGVQIGLPSIGTREVIYAETASFACHLILRGLYSNLGDWESWTKLPREALARQRLLVIGVGQIGSRVAQSMRSFVAVDTFDTATDPDECLEEKMRLADCVSIHTPLTQETVSFVNEERLSWLRDGALVVNTARGPIVDEEALYAELDQGRLRAALDVFWEEPYKGRLTEFRGPNLILTPHVASTCSQFVEGTAKDFLEFLSGLASISKESP